MTIVDPYTVRIVQEFIDAIAVEPQLIGKSLVVQYNETTSVKIIFPSPKNRVKDISSLNYKGDYKYLNTLVKEWGKKNLIYGVIIELTFKNEIPYRLDNFSEYGKVVNRMTSSALKYLSAICPDCFWRKQEFFMDYWSDVVETTTCLGGASWINMHNECELPGAVATKEMIEHAIAASGKTISEAYEFLSCAMRMRLYHDYRSCILVCATVIEIVLSKQIQGHFSTLTNKEVQAIMSRLNGYKALKDFMKKIGVNTPVNKSVDTSMQIRNKIIHEGLSPKLEDAVNALDAARHILNIYDIPIVV